jgi:hypothetical protein
MTRGQLRRRFPEIEYVCPKTEVPDSEFDEPLALARLAAWLDQGYRFSRRCQCLEAVAQDHYRCEGCFKDRTWKDHLHAWTDRDGRPVLTSQPYDFDADMEAELREDTEAAGLAYSIEPDASWWYPGYTTLIVICRRGPKKGTRR